MTVYAISRYWSIVHCCRVARVSLADTHGQEYFAIVPQVALRPKGARRYPLPADYRGPLDDVLDQISDAIDRRDVPGEVAVGVGEAHAT